MEMEQLPNALEAPLEKRRKSSTDDRFSELLDLVLEHIFSHLFFEQAAKTSLLSKRFNSLWNSIPSLSFHRRREIDVFSVKFGYNSVYRNAVYEWIKFAVERKVKSLRLNLYDRFYNDRDRVRIADIQMSLPKFLYDNGDLVKLVVNRCNVLSGELINWSSLRFLSLTRAKLNEGLISRVLSGCPLLNTLKLREWSGLNRVKIESVSLKVLRITEELRPKHAFRAEDEYVFEISGLNLVSLEVLGSLYRTKVRLSDLGGLVDAKMDFEVKPSSRCSKLSWLLVRDQDVAREVLESLCLVKSLTLGGWFIKILSICDAYNLPSPWSKRQSLTLCIPVIYWNHCGIASLLQSSPSLETLAIRLSYISDTTACPVEHVLFDVRDKEFFWKSWNIISKCPVLHLKTFKVINFRDSCRSMKPLFQFLEFLLRKSTVLEEIVIQASGYVTQGTIDEALKLLTIPTAFPDAVVKFEPPHLWVGIPFVYQKCAPPQSIVH